MRSNINNAGVGTFIWNTFLWEWEKNSSIPVLWPYSLSPYFVTQLMHDLYALLSTLFEKLRRDFSIPGAFPGLRWFIASFAPFCKMSGSSMGSSSTLTPSWVSSSTVSFAVYGFTQYYFFHLAFISSSSVKMFPFCSFKTLSLGVGFLVSDLMCLNMSLVLLTSLSFSLLVTTNYSWSTPYMRESRDDGVFRKRPKPKLVITVKMRFLLKWFQAVTSCQGKVCPQHMKKQATS